MGCPDGEWEDSEPQLRMDGMSWYFVDIGLGSNAAEGFLAVFGDKDGSGSGV